MLTFEYMLIQVHMNYFGKSNNVLQDLVYRIYHSIELHVGIGSNLTMKGYI